MKMPSRAPTLDIGDNLPPLKGEYQPRSNAQEEPMRIRSALKSRLRDFVVPTHQRRIGDRLYRIATDHPGSGTLLHWRPDWKSRLIDRHLTERPGVLIDVGANVGQTLLDYIASSSGAGYIGFEPNPCCADGVTAFIRNNALEDAALVPVGLSDRDHVARLYMRLGTSGADTGATLRQDLRPTRATETIFVPCFRFDGIAAELLDGRPVSIIKIDVEGAELQTLRGMREYLAAKRVPVICEVLHRAAAADAAAYARRSAMLMALLDEIGYWPFVIHKSADRAEVVDLERIDSFPLDAYSAETAELNDYIFMPA
jgi:FkbM family methyltransferase